MRDSTTSIVPNNRLLSKLSEEDYQSLRPQLSLVQMDFKQVLFVRDMPIEHVYFPVTSVFSILSFMYNGTAVEVATVGNEGFAGIDILVGGVVATDTTICQVAGNSFRMPASKFKEAVTDDTPLRRIAQRYLRSYLSQVSQFVACNRLHTIEERFARWVLMTHDRVGGDAFRLTHEFLADMLGVHRPSVSLVAGSFQQAGLIKYSRGNLTILDRTGLEEVSCECYAKVTSQFQRLLGA
jgi:CRP-like cAMP-binding protein